MTVVGLIDIATLVGFTAALAIVVYARLTRVRRIGGLSAVLIAVSMCLLLFVSVSNALEHGGITAALDPVEDYLEILAIPLLVYAMYAWYAAEQVARLKAVNRAVRSHHDMLSTLIESSPVGLLLVDPDGRVTFANDYAKRVLGLREREGASSLESRGHVIAEDGGRPAHPFSAVAGQRFQNRRFVFRTSERSTPIGISIGDMHAASGALVGSVVVLHLLEKMVLDAES